MKDLFSAVVLVLMAACTFALPLSIVAYRALTSRGGE